MSNDDVSTNLTLSLTHIFSTRLSFDASVSAAYQTEPNFKTNVGPHECALQSLRHDRYLFAGLSLAPAIYDDNKLHVHAR